MCTICWSIIACTTEVKFQTENHPTGREPATFFVALDHYAQLVSLGELSDFPVDIFFSATRRVIHAASDILYSILGTTKSNLNRLEVLHDLMRFVIKTSFLRLSSSKSFGFLLFNELSGLLLSPLIHSFFPLSIKSLEYLLEPTTSERQSTRQNGPDLHIDCRPKLVKLFQGIVSGLFSASYSLAKATSGDSFYQDASSMRDMLILETVRHLKEILSLSPVENHNPDSTTTRDEKITNPQEANKLNSCSATKLKDLRVRRLAVKDAMWYLCSVFHILIGSSSSAANSNMSIEDLDYVRHEGSEILGEKISQELFELVIDTHLRHHEKSWLPSQANSLADADITRTEAKTAQELLVSFLEGRSHRNIIQREKQQTLTSSKQFETTCEADTRPFDFSKHRTEAVNGTIRHMHVLDEAERGMLLCVVERYVNGK